jgi:uncharacterized membrane protein YbaN (DUF454 family)
VASRPLWRLVKILAGFFMVGLGVVGLFLPFLQGVLFILVGLAILSSESRRVRHVLDRLRARFPDVHRLERHMIERLKRRWSEKRGEAKGEQDRDGKAS